MRYSAYILTGVVLTSGLLLNGCGTLPELTPDEHTAIRGEDPEFSTAPGGKIHGGAVIGESIESGPGDLSHAP